MEEWRGRWAQSHGGDNGEWRWAGWERWGAVGSGGLVEWRWWSGGGGVEEWGNVDRGEDEGEESATECDRV